MRLYDDHEDPLQHVSVDTMPRFLGAAIDYGTASVVDWHSHPVGQLVHATSGSLRLSTADQVVLLPPSMALWVPPLVDHRIEFSSSAEMRTLYVRDDALRFDDERCRIITVSPLLRELLLAAMPLAVSRADTIRQKALFDLLAAEINAAGELPFSLPIPTDKRIRPLAMTAIATPRRVESVASWLADAPASRKTIERLFVRQTGFTPSQWLTQSRLIHAITELSEGVPVSTVALDFGYSTPSAFSYMFKRTIGMPPSAFSRGQRLVDELEES